MPEGILESGLFFPILESWFYLFFFIFPRVIFEGHSRVISKVILESFPEGHLESFPEGHF